MSEFNTVDENTQAFLIEMYNQSGGDLAAQVSMYDVGQAIGMDRDAASKTAEEVIGLGWVEVKTLNGGIALTDDGLNEAGRLGCGTAGSDTDEGFKLGNDPVIDEKGAMAIEQAVAFLKTATGEKSWNFNALAELMADLKTIDAQMVSSRPKTAIIRECLLSIRDVLKKSDETTLLNRINQLLGN